MKTIILTGGGTAGHILPNIALLPHLRENFDQIIYIGSPDSMEQNLLSNYPFVQFLPITTTKFRRSLSASNLLIPFKLYRGYRQALDIIRANQPSVIFSKGGYVSLPVILAGKKCNIPMLAHESDLSPGLTHRLTRKYFQNIFTTFRDTANKLPNGVFSGSPFGDILHGDKQLARRLWNLDINMPVLTVIGGSLGSTTLNKIIRECIPEITRTHQILHLTGKGKSNKNITHPHYHQVEFTTRMSEILSITDLCITRGGSNAIHELLALRIPMLIIPLSRGSRGDQVQNAQYFSSHGYALYLTEKHLDKTTFISKWRELLDKQNLIRSTTHNATPTDATTRIATALIRTANNPPK
ncbi:MAG: UDP-N-acetylglucosamine--N-acetylmuramyl-(pentapeptide) pyrophosphoryl-undecaprenol N-acetylglucosamine transferase [Clostridia bacterium]|nr:UDP-N-acetylglucosamine--N-acetylmuramyl-(pentapeptide) pyrophosphoryl-undecaprenol N-acetylglucosamine transferase [Clostridia bacterium]